MNWLSRLFATRRELKRLAAEVKFWRGRAIAFEQAAKNYQSLTHEHSLAWADRFITSQANTYAIGDGAKAKAEQTKTEQTGAMSDELTAELIAYRLKLEQDAKAAGLPVEKADELYRSTEADVIEQHKQEFGF